MCRKWWFFKSLLGPWVWEIDGNEGNKQRLYFI